MPTNRRTTKLCARVLCVSADTKESMSAFKSHQMSATKWVKHGNKNKHCVLFGNLFRLRLASKSERHTHNFNRKPNAQNRDIWHINEWNEIHNLNTQFRLRYTLTFTFTNTQSIPYIQMWNTFIWLKNSFVDQGQYSISFHSVCVHWLAGSLHGLFGGFDANAQGIKANRKFILCS